MHKFIKGLLAVIFSTLLFFMFLFTSMWVIVFNLGYNEKHYIKHDIMADTGLNQTDLMKVTDKMLLYLRDKEDNLDMRAAVEGRMEEVFGEREKLHMVDVKNLFLAGRNIRNGSLILFLGLLIYSSLKNKRLLINLLKSVKFVFTGIIVMLLGLGTLFLIDFNKYFIIFHEIFFDNDLWILDARTDILVNMVPEVFFFTIALNIIIIFIAAILTTIALSEVIWRRMARK